ncbi:MAG: TolB family protein, partial [bacterium]
ALSTQAAGKALLAGEYTRTGITYKTLISAGPGSRVPGGEITVVAPDGGRVAWSHRRNLIAFDRTGARGTFDIHTIRPDGAASRCLTCDLAGLPPSHRGNPAWHSSGAYIVFQSHDPRLQTGGGRIEGYLGTPGLGINNDIWVMTADGSRAWPLTRVRPGEGVLHPHFSRTGGQLLWSEIVDSTVRGMGGQWVIRLADFSTEAGAPALRNIRTLRPGNFQLYETHGFSPDDRWMLFSASPRGGSYYDLEIYAYAPASGKLLRLTRNDEWDEHAQFTEDGRHIVWASSEGIPQRKDPRDLRLDYWIMNADGSGKRRLTNFNEPGSPGFRPNTIVADFEFGPDGKTIVAKIGAAGRGETVVLIRLLD